MSRYKQFGKNVMFPEEIDTWRLGEDLPEWLSDQCRVRFDESYSLVPVISKTTTGYNLLSAGFNSGNLLSTTSESDYIAKDVSTGRLLVISEEGLNLMYKKKST